MGGGKEPLVARILGLFDLMNLFRFTVHNVTCHCEGVKRPLQSALLLQVVRRNLKILMRLLRRKMLLVMTVNFARFLRFVKYSNLIKKCAFTLAEVLITLGIIGVVAAITIPALIQKQYEKETVAKVKKAYSELSQAYLMAKNEFGTFDQWGITTNMSSAESHIIFGNNMKKYMKLSKDCIGMSSTNMNNNCPIKNFNASNSNYSRVVLNNGNVISFRMYYNNCSGNFGKGLLRNTCGAIILYTSPNKQSKGGKNKFLFFITKEGIVPAGVQNAMHEFNKACNKNIATPYPDFSKGNMYACTAWVIYNENMDYWHCDNLDWNTKTKCD